MVHIAKRQAVGGGQKNNTANDRDMSMCDCILILFHLCPCVLNLNYLLSSELKKND